MIININTFDIDYLETIVKDAVEEQNAIVGLFSGAWDQLHAFHIHHLEMARRLCDFLIVGVGTDRLVRYDKGSDRPIFTERDRLYMIDSISFVDACFLMDHENDFGIVAEQLINPYDGVIFKNQDWENRLNSIPGYNPDSNVKTRYNKGLDSIYGNVIIIPDVDCINSTTGFIKKIRGFKDEGIQCNCNHTESCPSI